MRSENYILVINIIINHLGYTGIGDRDPKRDLFFTKTVPKSVEQNQNKTFDENIIDSDDLQGEGVKFIEASNIIDLYTRLEVLLGLKLSGHTDAITEASNLFDELYKGGGIQTEQLYRKATNNFQTL